MPVLDGDYYKKEIESLRSKLAEAEKDVARIDFMGSKFTGVSDSERYLPFRLYWGRGQNKTIREVLDAAIAKQKEESK